MAPAVRILVRTDTDWTTMSQEKFNQQDDPYRPLNWIRVTGDRGIFRHWDEAFPISFFEYRHRLQDISMTSVAAASPDSVSVGLDDLTTWFGDDEDEIIVAMDDDDFVGPDVCQVVEHFADDVTIVTWPAVHVGFIHGKDVRTEAWAPLRQILPLNSAIRKSYLRERFSLDDVKMMLAHHPVANRMIAEDLGIATAEDGPILIELDHPSVALTGACHGVYNVHVGSIYFLQAALRKPDPVRYLRSLDLSSPLALPVHIQAFEPYVRELERIWGERS